MVRHQEGERCYWTLPGGGVEPGETFARAAEREVLEETGLEVSAVDLLWKGETNSGGIEECHLVKRLSPDREPSLGGDPEESHLCEPERMLVDVAWIALTDLTADGQISRVLTAMHERLAPGD